MKSLYYTNFCFWKSCWQLKIRLAAQKSKIPKIGHLAYTCMVSRVWSSQDGLKTHCRHDWWNSFAKRQFSQFKVRIFPVLRWKTLDNRVCRSIRQEFSQHKAGKNLRPNVWSSVCGCFFNFVLYYTELLYLRVLGPTNFFRFSCSLKHR